MGDLWGKANWGGSPVEQPHVHPELGRKGLWTRWWFRSVTCGADAADMEAADAVFGPRCAYEPMLNWRVFFGANFMLVLCALLVVVAGHMHSKLEDRGITEYIRHQWLGQPAPTMGSGAPPARGPKKQGKEGKGRHRR